MLTTWTATLTLTLAITPYGAGVVLFVVLGASGWWSNNSINNENPVFVQKSPERNRFPALGSFACQVGNVFPIFYKMFVGYCLSEETRRRIVAPTVYVGLISGALILMVSTRPCLLSRASSRCTLCTHAL